MALTCKLTKEGEGKKLVLPLKKEQPFTITLFYEGDVDLDLHAIRCYNDGSGAGSKAREYEDLLTTYNVVRQIRNESGKMETVGTLKRNSDGSFALPDGSMWHSKDALNGNEEVDEQVKIWANKLPVPMDGIGYIEIPLIAMVHPQEPTSPTFDQVKNAHIIVTDDSGAEILRADLGVEAAGALGYQFGSLLVSDASIQFNPTSVPFNDTFDTVLGFYS